MLNPKFKFKPPRINRRHPNNNHRFLPIALLLISSNWLSALPLLAASPGTVINNRATGSYTDPTDNSEKIFESNTVQVTIGEIAGITVTGIGTEEANNNVNNTNPNQGNNQINPDDIVYFKYKITNAGNDPTQFFIPDAPSSIINGTKAGDIEIIEYDPDGENGATQPTVLSSPVKIPNGGISTGDTNALDLPNGSIPPEGTVTIRVPIKVNSGINDGDKVTVVMGDTDPVNAQNQVYSGNATTKDIYTQDNEDTDNIPDEVNGKPVNGDETNHRQEASASQDVTVVKIILNSISGTLYEDSDGGDDLDPNEPKLPADITVNLLDSNNAVIATTTTQSDGTYIFTDVADGSYKIQVDTTDTDIPSGYTLGTANDLPITVSGNAVTDINFGFDLQPGICSIGGGTVDPNLNPYISQEVTRNVIATRNLTDTLDDDWRAAATGGTSQGNIVQPWFGTTNALGSVSNFTYVDPATSATTNTTVELVEVPIADIAPCAGQANDSSSNPILGTGDSLQASSPRPASLYDSSNQPAFWNQTPVPPSSTDNSRFAVRFTFDSPVKSFGAWFGDLETRIEDGTPAVLRLLDASGNRIGNDIAIAPNQISDGNSTQTVDQSQCGNSGTETGCGNESTRWVGFIDNNAIPRVKQVLVIVGDDDFNDNGDTEILSFIGANVVRGNPNVLLVKRITAVNGGTTNDGRDLASYVNDPDNPYDDNKLEGAKPPDYPSPDTDKWINTTEDTNSTFLIGETNGGKIKPNDEIEYTIYYLSSGTIPAKSVLFCDRVPENVTFVPNSFNNQTQATGGLQSADRGILWLKDGKTESLTNIQDGDFAQYFPPSIEPSSVYPSIKCDGANTNGAVVVNLEDLPNANAPGTPNTSYGFVRFRARVK